MNTFSQFFQTATTSNVNPDGFQPRQWQTSLGANKHASDLLIRIPTGEGKTLGALSTWLYHAIDKGAHQASEWVQIAFSNVTKSVMQSVEIVHTNR